MGAHDRLRISRIQPTLHIKGPEMPGTDDLVADQIPFRKRTTPVGTHVIAGKETARGMVQNDAFSAEEKPAHRTDRQFGYSRGLEKPGGAQFQIPGITVPQSGQAPSFVSRLESTRKPIRPTRSLLHLGQCVPSRSPKPPGILPGYT